MTKKDFIALAAMIREVNTIFASKPFSETAISYLADFCKAQNPNFNRARWIDYINGQYGPNGGKL